MKFLIVLLLSLSYTFAINLELNAVKQYEQQLAELSADDPYAKYMSEHISMLKQFKKSPDIPDWDYENSLRSKLFSIAKPVSHPIAIFLGGGTAAGKSSITTIWQKLINETGENGGYVHIDPDNIMMESWEWAEMLNTSNKLCLATDLHGTASQNASNWFDEALQKGVNIVFDGTLSSDSSVEKLNKAIEAYNGSVVIMGVTCDVASALNRSILRAANTNRYVPDCVLIDTHMKFSSRFLSFLEKNVSDVQLYDTNNGQNLIFQHNSIVNPQLFNEFMAKVSLTTDEAEKFLSDSGKQTYMDIVSNCNTPCKTASSTLDSTQSTTPVPTSQLPSTQSPSTSSTLAPMSTSTFNESTSTSTAVSATGKLQFWLVTVLVAPLYLLKIRQ